MAPHEPTVQVAFFRNMNLGQARSKSPTSAVLVGAFVSAGASRVDNFQTNGTVVFTADHPREVIAEVRPLLEAITGYNDAVLVRPADWLVDWADASTRLFRAARWPSSTPPTPGPSSCPGRTGRAR